MRPRIRGIDQIVGALGTPSLRIIGCFRRCGLRHVVEAEAALHAQPVLVRRTVLAGDVEQLVVLDVVGELAADAAIRAHAVDRAVGEVLRRADIRRRSPASTASARRSGRPARTRRRRRRSTAPIGSSKSNTIFSLWPRPAMPITSLTCTSRQARTHRLHWMQASRLTAIAIWLRSGAGSRSRAGRRLDRDLHAVGPVPELRGRIVRFRVAVGLIGDQQLEHHLARGLGAVGLRSSPSCRARACGCSLRRARARPRSRPCRRGSCRPAGSRAPARSTDAECRCPGAWRPARWSRPCAHAPRRRRA